jgi:hypothetical protein
MSETPKTRDIADLSPLSDVKIAQAELFDIFRQLGFMVTFEDLAPPTTDPFHRYGVDTIQNEACMRREIRTKPDTDQTGFELTISGPDDMDDAIVKAIIESGLFEVSEEGIIEDETGRHVNIRTMLPGEREAFRQAERCLRESNRPSIVRFAARIGNAIRSILPRASGTDNK